MIENQTDFFSTCYVKQTTRARTQLGGAVVAIPLVDSCHGNRDSSCGLDVCLSADLYFIVTHKQGGYLSIVNQLHATGHVQIDQASPQKSSQCRILNLACQFKLDLYLGWVAINHDIYVTQDRAKWRELVAALCPHQRWRGSWWGWRLFKFTAFWHQFVLFIFSDCLSKSVNLRARKL